MSDKKISIDVWVTEADTERAEAEQEQTRHNRHYSVNKATRESINRRLYLGLNSQVHYNPDSAKVKTQSKTEQYNITRCYR